MQATAQALLNLVSPLNPPDRPVRILYAGPASTGKTELAKAAAKELGVLDSPAFVSVLGSQLASDSDRSKVQGSAPGLVGAEAPTMFKALQQAVAYRDAVGPHCFIVVFIDEAHNIHPVIQTVLREFMYTGCMDGSTGGSLDVGRNILVIQASNWADQSIQEFWRHHGSNCPPDSLASLQELILKAMRAHKVEGPTVGRYGTIVPFLPLTEEQTIRALRLMCAGKTFGWKQVDMPDAMLRWMYRHLYDADLGLRHLYESHLLNALDTLMRSPTPLKEGEARQTVVVVEWNEAEQTATSVAISPQSAAAPSAAAPSQRVLLRCWQPAVPSRQPSALQPSPAWCCASDGHLQLQDAAASSGVKLTGCISPAGQDSMWLGNTSALLCRSLGRLLTRSPCASKAGQWEFSGQCVAIHSHLLLTAAHCCWDTDYGADDPNAKLQLKVLFMGEAERIRELDAVMIRWSGKMDVAILRVQGDSPFQPLQVAQVEDISETSSNVRCMLAAFPVTRDADCLGRSGSQLPATGVVGSDELRQLPHMPSVYEGPIVSAVDRFARRPSRHYLLARSRYLNQKGLSGGAVVGLSASGGLSLLGVHTHSDRVSYDNSLSYVDVTGRLLGPECDEDVLPDGSQRCSDGEINSPPPELVASSSEEASYPSQSTSRPTLASVANELQDVRSRVEHESGGQSEAVFVVAHSVLSVHPRWALAVLEQELPQSAATSSTASAHVTSSSRALIRVRRTFADVGTVSDSHSAASTTKGVHSPSLATACPQLHFGPLSHVVQGDIKGELGPAMASQSRVVATVSAASSSSAVSTTPAATAASAAYAAAPLQSMPSELFHQSSLPAACALLPSHSTSLLGEAVSKQDELFHAAAKGDVSTIGRFHQQGHSMNCCHPLGLSLLDAAGMNGHVDVLSYLLDHKLVDVQQHGLQALKSVLAHCFLEYAGPPPNRYDILQFCGRFSVGEAHLRLKMVQALLHAGAPCTGALDFVDPLHLALLHLPADESSHYLLQTLLRHGHPLLFHHRLLMQRRGIKAETYSSFVKQDGAMTAPLEHTIAAMHFSCTVDALGVAQCSYVHREELLRVLDVAFRSMRIDQHIPDVDLRKIDDAAL